MTNPKFRHCEERSDEAIQPVLGTLDCRVATLLAMTMGYADDDLARLS
jgi:hypothetical protein